LFIPLFFLVVNVGQAARIFPAKSTSFLHGQGYGAFQLPSSLLLAASFGSAALFLVEDIEVMEALRSLILEDLVWSKILYGFAVAAILGVVMLALNVRLIRNYD
jgi:ABC-2 type transport system permease protein